MRNKFGVFFMILGTVFLLGAVSLLIMNQQEDRKAGEMSQEVMMEMQKEIQDVQAAEIPEPPDLLENTPVEFLTEEDLIMTERVIKGYPYIGYLSIPDLMLQLPVMSDWNNQRLQIAPCRYTGTLRGRDLVLMAHSFASHFGKLSSLSEGAEIQFTDMDGNIWYYEIVVMDVLDAYAVEEMTAGEYDLTLFTCTKDRQHRVTVRCNMVEE